MGTGTGNEKSDEPAKKWKRLTAWLDESDTICTVHGDIPVRQWLGILHARLGSDQRIWEEVAIRVGKKGTLSLWGLPTDDYEGSKSKECVVSCFEADKERLQKARDHELVEYAEHVVRLGWVKDPDLWLRVLRLAAHRQAQIAGRIEDEEEEREPLKYKMSIPHQKEKETTHCTLYGRATRFIIPARKS